MSNDPTFIYFDLNYPGDIGTVEPGNGRFLRITVEPPEEHDYGILIQVSDASTHASPEGALKLQVLDATSTDPVINFDNRGLGPDIQLASGVTISESSGDLELSNGSGSIVLTGTTVDINNTDPVDIAGSLAVDTGNTQISIGSGAVSSEGPLQVSSSASTAELSGAGNVTVASSGGEVYLDDSRTASIPFSDVANTTLFGGASSLLGAITAAGDAGLRITRGLVSVNSGGIPAGTTVTSANTTQVPSAPNGLVSYVDSSQFVGNLLISLDGMLLANGVDSTTNNDVYADGVASNGEMAFEFDLEEGQIIQVIKLVV